MAWQKSEFNYKKAQKLVLAGASAFLFLTPTAEAIELSPVNNTAETLNVQPPTAATHPSEMPLLIAQASFCGEQGMRVEASYETNNFYVDICYDRSNSLWYFGRTKGSGDSIKLPAYSEEGTGYVADNGEYTYIINGAGLTILQNGQVVQEDSVVNY